MMGFFGGLGSLEVLDFFDIYESSIMALWWFFIGGEGGLGGYHFFSFSRVIYWWEMGQVEAGRWGEI